MAFEAVAAFPVLIDPFPTYRSDSGYSHAHALLKAASRPPGCTTIGQRKEGSGTDSKFTVTWQVPESLDLRFLQWAMGYSYLKAVPVIPGVNSAPYRLSREIPDQHFQSPAHYATSFREVGRGGTYILGINNVALGTPRNQQVNLPYLDQDGNPVALGQGAEPLLGPTYIDNQGYKNFEGKVVYDVEYTIPRYTILTDAELDAANLAGPNLQELRRYVEYALTWNVQAVPIGRVANGSQSPASTDANPGTKNLLLQFTVPPYPGNVTTVPEGGLLLVPAGQVRLTWIGVPDIPHAAITAAMGKVNVGTFGGVGRIPSFDNETLLFQSPKTVERNQVTGRACYDIEFALDWKPVYALDAAGKNVLDAAGNIVAGWNCFPSGLTSGFYPALLGGNAAGATKVFTPTNFIGTAQLFQGNGYPFTPINYVGSGAGVA